MLNERGFKVLLLMIMVMNMMIVTQKNDKIIIVK
jgi:hypothetical protein